MYRELLTTNSSTTCKQTSLVLTEVLLKSLEYNLVVKVCVVVVHLDRIHTIVILTLGWDSLTEVCLDVIYAHLKELLEHTLEPVASLRIGKVNDCHTRLPQICLEYASIQILDEVSLLLTDIEQLRLL